MGAMTGSSMCGGADSVAAFASGQSISGFPGMTSWGNPSNACSGACADVAFATAFGALKTQGVALQGTAGSVPDMGNNLDFVAGGAVHSSMANASAGAMNDAMDMRSGMGNAMFGPLGTA